MRSGRPLLHPVALLGAGLLLAGCNTLGPPSVRRAPFEYNEALVRSRNEQLLLNLVRLRYRDTPYFLEPTSLSTQYELSGGVNAGITVVEGGDGDASAGTGISVVEREGRPGAAAGPSSAAEGPTEAAPDEVEYRLLLRDPWREDVPEDVCAVPLPPTASAAAARALPAPEEWPGEGLVLRNAYLDEVEPSEREIAVETRSLLEAMYYLSQGVDAPSEHGPGGRGLVTHAAGCGEGNAVAPEVAPWRELTRNLFRVRCSRSRPDGAFARVRYQETWFYVPDDDLDSKSTFGLLMQLYSLQSDDARGMTPQLTLDLGG